MIKIENLTKSYRTPTGRHYVFKDLNLEIPSGKSVAFIGRNGAGKSTLLRMIGGIDRPDSGKIITNKTISWPVGLAGGFQGSLTGRENVKFVARLYAKQEELKEKIEFVEESSFLMVSHSLNSLKEFCDVAIVFKNDNAVSFYEDVQGGIEEYRCDGILNPLP